MALMVSPDSLEIYTLVCYNKFTVNGTVINNLVGVTCFDNHFVRVQFHCHNSVNQQFFGVRQLHALNCIKDVILLWLLQNSEQCISIFSRLQSGIS